MPLCEHPDGCSSEATCRLVIRNVTSENPTFRHYCQAHAREEWMTIEEQQTFVIDNAQPI